MWSANLTVGATPGRPSSEGDAVDAFDLTNLRCGTPGARRFRRPLREWLEALASQEPHHECLRTFTAEGCCPGDAQHKGDRLLVVADELCPRCQESLRRMEAGPLPAVAVALDPDQPPRQPGWSGSCRHRRAVLLMPQPVAVYDLTDVAPDWPEGDTLTGAIGDYWQAEQERDPDHLCLTLTPCCASRQPHQGDRVLLMADQVCQRCQRALQQAGLGPLPALRLPFQPQRPPDGWKGWMGDCYSGFAFILRGE